MDKKTIKTFVRNIQADGRTGLSRETSRPISFVFELLRIKIQFYKRTVQPMSVMYKSQLGKSRVKIPMKRTSRRKSNRKMRFCAMARLRLPHLSTSSVEILIHSIFHHKSTYFLCNHRIKNKSHIDNINRSIWPIIKT